jgi:zinc-finger of transposase IS204/IS1001/IS1096/IS1165
MEELVFGWENVQIEAMERQAKHLEILLRPTTVSADCPLCHQSSQRVHSAYLRSLQDLPCCGQVLRLRIAVRRFFCDNTACRRKVFAERLPELMLPYARRTVRHNEALTTIGLAHGGEAGNVPHKPWVFASAGTYCYAACGAFPIHRRVKFASSVWMILRYGVASTTARC